VWAPAATTRAKCSLANLPAARRTDAAAGSGLRDESSEILWRTWLRAGSPGGARAGRGWRENTGRVDSDPFPSLDPDSLFTVRKPKEN
jgi:hypothetical protein